MCTKFWHRETYVVRHETTLEEIRASIRRILAEIGRN